MAYLKDIVEDLIKSKNLKGLSESQGRPILHDLSRIMGNKPDRDKIEKAMARLATVRPEYRALQDRHVIDEIYKRFHR